MPRQSFRCLILLGFLLPLSAQQDRGLKDIIPPDHPDNRRLPNGTLQSDAILKQDHEKSLTDVRQMVDLATSLQKDLERNGAATVLSLDDIRKTEEIEKIAKRIRSRIRRY